MRWQRFKRRVICLWAVLWAEEWLLATARDEDVLVRIVATEDQTEEFMEYIGETWRDLSSNNDH